MSSPADQISDLLPNTIVGGSTGWIRMVGKMPDSPNKVVCFYDTGGLPPNPKWLLDYRSIQVVVRGEPNTYGDTYTKIQEVRDKLLGLDPATLVSGDRIDGITGLGDINFLEYDLESRPKFSVNFRIFWEPATNALTSREPL